jgi:hypothetical protein
MNLRTTYSCLVLIFLFSQQLKANDTVHVTTHNRETVITDPSKGYNEYKRWGVFPSAETPVRKIILHLHFGCPDSLRCADWDYLDFISIKRVNGINGPNKDFEIARMLTPYGGAFNKDWRFDWELDVTDFSLLLRDSVEIEYNHSGYESNKDRGWQITVDFEIIKGQPAAEPISIEKVYSGSFRYGDAASPTETYLKPFAFTRKKKTSFAKFRVYQTGHGDNSADECGEFCSKKRSVVFNGEVIDTRPIWKKCGDNPLYPQAGTWILDRANWCPGYLQIPDEYLLPLKDSNSIDINMEPYEVAKSEAVENITAYLIQYKRAKTKNDASIEDILVPSSKTTNLRSNPACANARILIRNNGQNDLNKLLITYGTIGFAERKYLWKGNLGRGQQTSITLPGSIDAGNGDNTFVVTVSKPNGKTDDFAVDNKMTSHFEKVPVHGKDMVLVFKTNNQPGHNSYTLTNSTGEVVYQRKFDSTGKARLFKDTFHLKDGCYQLHIKDTAGDGLEFWYNTRGGRGYTWLQDVRSNLLKTFESDFGSGLTYNFIVSSDTSQRSPMNTESAIGLYPTRTNGKTTLDYFGGIAKDLTVQIITDEGAKLVEEHQYKNLKEGSFTYDLSYRPAQRYYLKVFIDGRLQFNKRIRVVDEPIR